MLELFFIGTDQRLTVSQLRAGMVLFPPKIKLDLSKSFATFYFSQRIKIEATLG